MDVSFNELVRLTRIQIERTARLCVNDIDEHFSVRAESAGGLLAQALLAETALVARQRYDDTPVRALLACVISEIAGGSRRPPSAALDSVTLFEKTFLRGQGEQHGLGLIAKRTAAELVNSRIVASKPLPTDDNLDRLIWLLFGDKKPTPDYTIGELLPRLSARLDEHVAGLKKLFADHVVAHLVGRMPLENDPLPIAAPLLIACALPAHASGEDLASAYRIHYEVDQHSPIPSRCLDAGAEVHIAPEGASQAIERVHTHLRHRWYPAATAVAVKQVDVLPAAAFPDVSRHFSVVVEGADPNFSSLAIGRTRSEARANLESVRPYPNVTLRERPLYISGRKARPPLRLDRFLSAIAAVERHIR